MQSLPCSLYLGLKIVNEIILQTCGITSRNRTLGISKHNILSIIGKNMVEISFLWRQFMHSSKKRFTLFPDLNSLCFSTQTRMYEIIIPDHLTPPTSLTATSCNINVRNSIHLYVFIFVGSVLSAFTLSSDYFVFKLRRHIFHPHTAVFIRMFLI